MWEEISRPAALGAEPIPQKHDLLEVNEYLDSGLVVSPIDKWFMSGIPTFGPDELGKSPDQDIKALVTQARHLLKDRITWPPVSVVSSALTHVF